MPSQLPFFLGELLRMPFYYLATRYLQSTEQLTCIDCGPQALNSIANVRSNICQVTSFTLNDLPIDWLPIVHNNVYISQGSSLPSLFSFQIRRTVAKRKQSKSLRKILHMTQDLLIMMTSKTRSSESLPLLLALQTHSGYKHKTHQSSLHAPTMDQDTTCILIG